MKFKSMRYEKWILCLLIVVCCEIARADLSVLEKLRSNDPNRWYEVSDVGYDLALMGDDAVPFLIQTLTDKDRSARLSAIGFLANYASDTRVLPALTEVFSSDPDQYLRLAAAREIANIDPDYARPLLIECMRIDIESGYRLIAVNALEELGEERALPMFVLQLVSELEHPNKHWGAALRLARLKDKRAVPVLLDILNDKELETHTKRRAALALAHLKDKRAVPFLLDMLDDKELDNYTKEQMLERLAQLGDERAIPALKKQALIYSDGNYDIREFALSALARFSSRDLTPMWIEILDDVSSQSLHITAIKGLGMSGGPGAIETLWRAAYRSNNYRVAAVLALQKLGDDSGVEWLREIAWRQLQHWSKEKRESGIRILRELRRNEQQSRHYQSPDPQYFLTWAWFSAMIADRQIALEWLAAGGNRIMVADVEGLLKHSDPVIQQTAAYQLARLGNAAGVHLIQPDLYADDARIRGKARRAFLSVRSE